MRFVESHALRLLPPVDWTSIFVIIPLVLIALGWRDSVRQSKDGVQEWYFAGYEFIYLLWPWHLEPRFFVPIAPLACLFMWRGGNAFVLLVRNNPRVIGAVLLPVTIALCDLRLACHSRTPDREPTSLYSTTGRAFFRYLAPLSDSLSVGYLAEYRLLQACFSPSPHCHTRCWLPAVVNG